MTASTVFTWNGTAIDGQVGDWLRSLRVQPEFGPLEWPGLSREAAGWGGVYAGPGTPAARRTQLIVESRWNGEGAKPTTDMRYEMRKELDAIAAIFSPSLGEKRLVMTDSGEGGSEVDIRVLLCRAERAYSYRDSQSGDGGIGGRPIGRVVYSVEMTSTWPWWIGEPTGLTGTHTGIGSTNITGSGTVAGGWRFKLTPPALQTAAPTVTITVGGVAVPLVWRYGAVWAGSAGDVAYLEVWWPEGQRAGARSYIMRAGAMREKGVWGLDLAGLTGIPLIAPSGTTAVTVAISGVNSGGTCAFDRVTLHEAF